MATDFLIATKTQKTARNNFYWLTLSVVCENYYMGKQNYNYVCQCAGMKRKLRLEYIDLPLTKCISDSIKRHTDWPVQICATPGHFILALHYAKKLRVTIINKFTRRNKNHKTLNLLDTNLLYLNFKTHPLSYRRCSICIPVHIPQNKSHP